MTSDSDNNPHPSPDEEGAVSSGSERLADDKMVLAAEYALGTLDADDRANVQMLMAIDPIFGAAVADWERRLGELHALVGTVEPPAATWEWIKARIAIEPQLGRLWLPTPEEVTAPAIATPRAAERMPDPVESASGEPGDEATASVAVPEGASSSAQVIAFRSQARRWRRATLGLGALAATFVAVVLARELSPELLPEQLQPTSRIIKEPVEVIRTVEVVREIPSPRIAEYVAILQREGGGTAFLLTIDTARHILSVRRVDASEQAGKDYELWLVSDKFPAPRSLGIVGEQEFTVRRALDDYDAPTLNAATYAVSVEPSGGSPSGAPTGPVVFTGKLMQVTPPAFPGPTP